MIISDGVTPATAFQEIKDIHKKYKYRNMQPQSSFLAMEGENFKLLESLSNMFISYEKMGDKSYEAEMRHLISHGGVPAIKEDGPAIKEGGPAITQHAADEPAAPGKTTPGETIALEKHKEKVGPSPADESDTNESNLQSMFLWGFTGIVCWWTFGRD